MLSAFRPANVLDITTGTLIPNTIIFIENDRIARVGSHLSMPTNTKIIDLPGITLVPGLIDSHTHITYHYDKNGKFGFTDQSTEEILRGSHKNLRKTLLAGFTTIRDVGASNGIDFTLRKLIQNGKIIGPRLLISGEPIFSPNDNVEDRLENNPDVIKIFNGMQNDYQANFNSRQIRSIVNIASQSGIPVAVHSFEPLPTIESSNGGATNIEHGSFINEQAAKVMAKNGTTLVPTLSMPLFYLNNREKFNFDPKNWAHFEKAARSGLFSVNLAKSEGINIVFGTDSVAGMHGFNAYEFLLLNNAGLTPLECIQAATIKAARMLRIYDIGEIKERFKADLVGIPGNPLEDLSWLLPHNIKFVMKDGKLVVS